MPTTAMSDLSPELLAQHDGWLRALVRKLVDDGQTDDVLQEVWSHAMHAELRDQQALPGWLARVARRIAGKTVRSKQRQRQHEQAAAVDAARSAAAEPVDPCELVARVEERQEVAKVVLQLDEPFRTVVLLRYFEDQTPEQIARRLNVPGATVRSRLHRAHEQLRRRFEQQRGRDWRGQLAALAAPLATIEGTTAVGTTAVGTTAAGTTAVNTTAATQPSSLASSKALFLVVPIAIAAATWLALWLGPPEQTAPPSTSQVASRTTTAATASEPEPGDSLAAGDAERVVVKPAASPPDSTTDRTTIRIAGEVVDHVGQPIPELAIAFVPGWPKRGGPNPAELQLLGSCDRSGHFEFELPRAQGSLRVHRHFATLRSWLVTGQEQPAGIDDAVIVAAPLVQLSGTVVDRNGKAAADQRVGIAVEDTVGLPISTAGTYLETWHIETRSDALGNFQLANVPGYPLGDLGVGRILITDARIPIPTQDRHDLRLVLGTGQRVRPPPAKRAAIGGVDFTIRGTVVTATGDPIAAAYAFAPATRAEDHTNADGQFQLSGNTATNVATTILVTAPGYAPQSIEVWPQPGTDDVQLTAGLEELGEASLAVSGRLVDDHNEPVAGMLVVLGDAIQLDPGSLSPRFIECPTPHEHGPHAITDPQGRFRIPGVLDRRYQLRVIDQATGFAQTHGPFAAGTPLNLRIAQPHTRPQMQLQVVDVAGLKVPDAAVAMQVVKIHSVVTGPGTSTFTSFVGDTQTATTNAAGECTFADAPGGDLRFTIKKPGFVPIEIDHRDPTNRLEVRLPRLVPFRVATHGMDDRWPVLKLFDAAGNELDVRPAWRGDRYPTSHKFGVTRGHSVVAAFPETVRRAELRSLFGQELLRAMPVIVNYDGITVLDFPE